MPFVVFRNSKGRGVVVPDGHGGTKLVYLMPNTGDGSLDPPNSFEYKSEVVVEDIDIDGVAQRIEPDTGSHDPSVYQPPALSPSS